MNKLLFHQIFNRPWQWHWAIAIGGIGIGPLALALGIAIEPQALVAFESDYWHRPWASSLQRKWKPNLFIENHYTTLGKRILLLKILAKSLQNSFFH